jgi:hypothetical protein
VKPATAEPKSVRKRPSKPRFPWLLFLLLLASVYAFWILPQQLGPRQVHVEFVNDEHGKR